MSESRIAYGDIYLEGTLIHSFLVEDKISHNLERKTEGVFFFSITNKLKYSEQIQTKLQN